MNVRLFSLRHSAYGRHHGFTLIELLVVMVLLGLVTSIAITTVGSGNQGRELANEANRLHAVLRMGADEAVFSNAEIGVVLESNFYEFLVYDEEGGQWQNASQNFLRSYTLPEWMVLDYQREGKEKKLLDRSAPVEEEPSDDEPEKNTKKPHVMLLSSGEVTAFIIGLQIADDIDTRIEIKTNEQGEIILPAAQEE